ncbi:PqqD family protein [Intrasporangium calvum]|uniref:PqqD family protein n=1 Tax=Intrasporangium calvum TaxID=53358 RepID=A0ABT5GHG5_9MICO|nr:PqqD family protein [Intrasporangium calvum]MDC5697692.1 PqqD family protein [Intrasporangium calvum]
MTSPAAYGPAPDVGRVDADELTYVARLPEGPALVLAESAAVIWAEASEGGSLEQIVERVADAFALPPHAIEADVTAFVAQLVALGLIVRTDT